MNLNSNLRDLNIVSSLWGGVFLFATGLGCYGQDQDTGGKEKEGAADQRPAYRFNARKKTTPVAPSKRSESLPDGAVSIGVVTEQATLPPELKELAQQGAMAVAVKDWKRAQGVFLKLIEKAPDNALAYANLGVVEHQLKNLSAAGANLTRSLQINPTISKNWLSLGLVHYEKGDLNLAISSLTRAIHEAPNDGHIRLVLAAVIRDYGWEEAAIMELKRALMIDGKLADAHYNLALSYLGFDPPKLELARRHYYSAIDLGTEPSKEIEKQLGVVSEEK